MPFSIRISREYFTLSFVANATVRTKLWLQVRCNYDTYCSYKSRTTLATSFLWSAEWWFWSRRLGLETVSRSTNVSSRSRLGLGRQTSRSRPSTSRAQDQFSAKLCKPQYAVWTALDVVSLCCSYYCSSY